MSKSACEISLPRIGVLLHVYYIELLPSLMRVLGHFPADVTVLVSTQAKHQVNVEQQLRSAAPNATCVVKPVPNVGFDIAPMLICFAEQLLSLDIVCKLHTKNSRHYEPHAGWREHLIHNLAGSPAIVTAAVKRFQSNPKLGVVLGGAYPTLRGSMQWNETHLEVGADLINELELPLESILDFPAGAMFWFRPAVFKPLFDRSWAWENFEFEGQEGLAHVIERLVLLLAHQQGFTWAKVDNLGAAMSLEPPVLPAPPLSTVARQSIAVVLHVWSLDGLFKAVSAIKNIPLQFDLYVTISSEQTEAVESMLEQHFSADNYQIIEVENVGHDVAPFLALADKLLAYELVCKLHLKPNSQRWFDYLVSNLLGGMIEVNVILAMFARDSELGLVYPQTYLSQEGRLSWGGNYPRAKQIALGAGLPVPNAQHERFITSTMFWCRPKALRKLFNFTDYQFNENDNTKADGAESHAVERLMLWCCESERYNARSVLMHAQNNRETSIP